MGCFENRHLETGQIVKVLRSTSMVFQRNYEGIRRGGRHQEYQHTLGSHGCVGNEEVGRQIWVCETRHRVVIVMQNQVFRVCVVETKRADTRQLQARPGRSRSVEAWMS